RPPFRGPACPRPAPGPPRNIAGGLASRMPFQKPAAPESAEELARKMLAGLEMRRFLPAAGPHLPEWWPSLAPLFDPVVDPVPPRPGLLGRVRNRFRRTARALVLPGLRLWGRLN